jgi:hypothetical protein
MSEEKNAFFWDVTPRGSGRNRRLGGTYRLHHQVIRIGEIVTANIVSSSPILVILMMEAIRSSETSVLQEPRRVASHIFELQCYVTNLVVFTKQSLNNKHIFPLTCCEGP